MANYPNYNLYGKRPAETFRNIVQFNSTASNLVDSYGDDLWSASFASFNITASVLGTSSWANNAVSASWAPFTDTGTTLVTASTYQITASVANNAISASWAPFTQTEQVSASWASSSLSSSYISASTAIIENASITTGTYSLKTLAVNEESYSLDFSSFYLSVDTTGSFTFYTSSNGAAVRNASVFIKSQSSPRSMSFNQNWVFLGTVPTTIAANKTAILSITTFGIDDSNVVVAYGVQQ